MAKPWTTDTIREAFIYDGGESAHYDPVNGEREHRRIAGGIFDAWLAAHDAEKRAEWEAEQGEVEWEYGAQHSQGTNPHPSRKQAEEMVAWHAAGDARKHPTARGKSKLVRRRKAGEWVPVNENGEDDADPR